MYSFIFNIESTIDFHIVKKKLKPEKFNFVLSISNRTSKTNLKKSSNALTESVVLFIKLQMLGFGSYIVKRHFSISCIIQLLSSQPVVRIYHYCQYRMQH